MTWIKLEDTFPDHPRVAGLTDAAKVAFIEGLCYCSRHLTDGMIPRSVAGRFWRRSVVDELVASGLWADEAGDVVVTEYLVHQRSREQVENERTRDRVRKKSRRDAARTPDGIPRPELETETELPPKPPKGGSSRGRGGVDQGPRLQSVDELREDYQPVAPPWRTDAKETA